MENKRKEWAARVGIVPDPEWFDEMNAKAMEKLYDLIAKLKKQHASGPKHEHLLAIYNCDDEGEWTAAIVHTSLTEKEIQRVINLYKKADPFYTWDTLKRLLIDIFGNDIKFLSPDMEVRGP